MVSRNAMGAENKTGHASGTVLFLALALVTAGMVVYSQTMAFAWDEGFHILTAQLIKHGKRPYLDFVFSQTPLNAYWNAVWMAIFGESWRVTHAIAALCSAGAVILTTLFVFSRFPVSRWRRPGALLVTSLVGLNVLVVKFGSLAQAYGLCLLAIVAAYRFAVWSVEQQASFPAALSGLASGIGAGSSLLTAPVGPVLLIWVLLYSRGRRRWASFAAFILGYAAALLPVLWLFVQGPRQVFFGIFEYNALYRQLDWPGALGHNFEVFASLIDYGPALLVLLAANGLLFIRSRSGWDPQLKREFYLCAWLSTVLAVYTSAVLPTFERYYIFTVPFLAILAVAGTYAAVSSVDSLARPWRPVVVLMLFVSIGLGKSMYDKRLDMVWPDLEITARMVNDVTAPQQTLFADEAIYFLTRHNPPSGMEMANSHKFNFPPARLALLHLIPQGDLDRQIDAEVFGTLETCAEEDELKARGYAKLYAKNAVAGECTVFWDRRSAAH